MRCLPLQLLFQIPGSRFELVLCDLDASLQYSEPNDTRIVGLREQGELNHV